MKKSRPVRPLKAWAIIVSVILLLCGAYAWRQHQADQRSRISYTAFIDRVNAGEIKSVRTEGDEIIALAASGVKYKLYRPADAELSQLLLAKHIEFSANAPAARSLWIELCFLLVLLVPLFFVFKRLAVFGRSSARLTDGSRSTTLFTDVAGADEAKIDLQETVEFLKDPQKFAKLGARCRPGCCWSVPGNRQDPAGARRCRRGRCAVLCHVRLRIRRDVRGGGRVPRQGPVCPCKKVAPCIIFIDELDAVGRRRDAGGNGASDERDQTLNQLLVEMDGFTVNSGIVIIAATNRPEVLDPALLRPGRFDRQVMVGNPDIRGREEILKVHTRSIPLAAEVDLLVIARERPAFPGRIWPMSSMKPPFWQPGRTSPFWRWSTSTWRVTRY